MASVKRKISKELRDKILSEADRDFLYDSRGFGNAESLPFKIVRYASKEKSAKMKAEIEAMVEKWRKALSKVKATKAYDLFDDAYTLDNGSGLFPQACYDWDRRAENMIETSICGYNVFVQCLEAVVLKTRTKRVQVRKLPLLSPPRRCNVTYWDSSWRDRVYDGVHIGWDAGKEQYFVIEYKYVQNVPVDAELYARKSSWPRSRKRSEFKKLVREKINELLEKGIEIRGVVEIPSNSWIKIDGPHRKHCNYVDCFDPEEDPLKEEIPQPNP